MNMSKCRKKSNDALSLVISLIGFAIGFLIGRMCDCKCCGDCEE